MRIAARTGWDGNPDIKGAPQNTQRNSPTVAAFRPWRGSASICRSLVPTAIIPHPYPLAGGWGSVGKPDFPASLLEGRVMARLSLTFSSMQHEKRVEHAVFTVGVWTGWKDASATLAGGLNREGKGCGGASTNPDVQGRGPRKPGPRAQPFHEKSGSLSTKGMSYPQILATYPQIRDARSRRSRPRTSRATSTAKHRAARRPPVFRLSGAQLVERSLNICEGERSGVLLAAFGGIVKVQRVDKVAED